MWVVFDAAIFGFLISTGVWMIHSGRSWRTLVIGIAWCVIFYGSFIEPRLLVVREEVVDLAGVAEETKEISVAVVADFHTGVYKRTAWVERVVDVINAQEPDVVLIPGDFILNKREDVRWLTPLEQLSAPFGVYAVLGNHDFHDGAHRDVRSVLATAGVIVLDNESVVIDVGETTFALVGVRDWWNDPDLDMALDGIESEDTVVMLEHNPDVLLDERSRLADLVLSGHTHGGQIRLPFLGPVPPVPTELGNAFDQGWFEFDDTKLFITSGVGESGPRARLFNPPEIVMMSVQLPL